MISNIVELQPKLLQQFMLYTYVTRFLGLWAMSECDRDLSWWHSVAASYSGRPLHLYRWMKVTVTCDSAVKLAGKHVVERYEGKPTYQEV